ncbi:MAG: hypothetical protein HYT16_00640 [DPANN group archaeon]|nr:hypothetical protein [DPANN group archaeon]
MVQKLRIVDARVSNLPELEEILAQRGKTQLIFLDANVILDGLYQDKRFGGSVPESRVRLVASATEAMGLIERGNSAGPYALALFRPTHTELRDAVDSYGNETRTRFYSWLGAATQNNSPFIMLGGDRQLVLPLEVRAAFTNNAGLHVGAHSNAWDKALVATAIKITREIPSLAVAVVSHDHDINNQGLKVALETYRVKVYNATKLCSLLQPRTAASPA